MAALVNIPKLLGEKVLNKDVKKWTSFSNKIIGFFRNYGDIPVDPKSSAMAIPNKPVFWMKPVETYVQQPNPILYPSGVKIVHEAVELGVIIGKEMKDVPQDQVMGYIGGYCLALDMTAKDMLKATRMKGRPWSECKGFKTFTPVSDYIPRDAITNIDDLKIWAKVDGETKQEGHTGDMIFKIPALLSAVSYCMTLLPGDLLLTGTPGGNGPVNVGQTIHAGLTEGGKNISEIKFKVEAASKPPEIKYEKKEEPKIVKTVAQRKAEAARKAAAERRAAAAKRAERERKARLQKEKEKKEGDGKEGGEKKQPGNPEGTAAGK